MKYSKSSITYREVDRYKWHQQNLKLNKKVTHTHTHTHTHIYIYICMYVYIYWWTSKIQLWLPKRLLKCWFLSGFSPQKLLAMTGIKAVTLFASDSILDVIGLFTAGNAS